MSLTAGLTGIARAARLTGRATVNVDRGQRGSNRSDALIHVAIVIDVLALAKKRTLLGIAAIGGAVPLQLRLALPVALSLAVDLAL